jgi:hypothetical protein
MKSFTKLTIADFETCPVWEFTTNGRTVKPVASLPVRSLANRAVGTKVKLACGEVRWAILLNLSLEEPEYNVHLLTALLWDKGKWIELGRYFDVDYEDKNAEALAGHLGLPVSAVFPIEYDMSALATGPVSAVVGRIPAEVKEQLPFGQLVQFIIRKHAPKGT